MKPDAMINGVSMLSLGWLRETVNFPTPQSQSNTITVPGRNSPIRFTEALGRVAYQPRSFDMTFSMLGNRADYNLLVSLVVNQFAGKLCQVTLTEEGLALQNEMVSILKKYAQDLPGGVFHCFTGNEKEAAELLQFDRFVLGVGGVLTFKKSHLPEVLPQVVPLDRIVLETDAPYMAPVPMRGQRNEPSYVQYVLQRMAEAYGINEEELARKTNENVVRVFDVKI